MKAIESITIKNSPFFKEDFKVKFSNKLNCIMGGRGTGKSTILHFIKAAINPQSEKDNTTYSLLKNNLDQGEIILRFKTKNNSSYDISKYFNDEPQPEDSITHESVNLKSILEDLSCDIYEAARIEEIGRKPEDRLKLIDKMLPVEVDEIKDEIRSMQITIEKNAQEIKTIKARYDQKQEKIEDFEPVLEELKLHKKNKPKDLDDAIDKEFEKEGKKQKTRRSEKKFLKGLIDFQDEILMDLAEIKEKTNEFKVNNDPDDFTFVNKTLMQPAIKIFQSSSDDLLNKIKTIEKSWTKSKTQCEQQNDKLEKAHEKQTIEYNTIKKKIEKNRQYYTKLEQLSKKEEHLKSLRKECKELERKKNKKAKERNSLINQLNALKQKLYSNRLEIVQNLNNQFNGEIKILLHIGGLTDEYEKILRNSLRGSKIKYNELIPRIVKYFPPDKFAEIIHNKDKDKLKSIFHIDESRATTIIDKLYQTDDIYTIESLYCEDLPNFHLRIDKESKSKKDNYTISEELSTGQRCTTVLPIIFAVSKNPLIIDQPEDNLDNKYITQSIYKIVNAEKEKRQLIFITHNPNIPVLSDSEFNVFLDFHKYSEVTAKGSVDDVKENILTVLEGGKDAFKRRNRIYKIFNTR